MTRTSGADAVAGAKRYETQIVRFLREMIAIPAESGRERERCERVKAEYEKLGFADVRFDGIGSVVARVGEGPLVIMMDGHIDCVGIGDPQAWTYDPFAGKLEGGKVHGRGAVDELPAIACMAYGAKLLAERGLPPGVQIVLVASVLEEACDGFPLMHLIETEGVRPDVVVLGEPTNLDVYRGHRGRMEIEVVTKGVSAHGAHCERGVNAVYKMAPIVADIEALNATLRSDDFLGKGTVTVSFIDCKTPSLNAVPDEARIVLDRRLTAGESPESALEEIRALPHLGDAGVRVLAWEGQAWTGAPARQEQVFPTWVVPEAHPLVQGVAAAAQAVLGRAPAISRWVFSTNGVATMGRLGIPTVGFAPGREELAHTTDEWVEVADLVTAAAVYSLIPEDLAQRMRR
ncbi:MAG TPA: YgeY family selenium metabolism-linked hydrolase [Thermoanaerobaculaceae bacterium]|nr:MAG: selenium metabolism hydrolase [Acidobacteria bacterium 37-71-11]HQT95284.1 YgeY family selenium metabolism-linked hydrolase [Thermoanaerobaculaceae bacterium]HQU33840.1 YgeY family selenium metabolism-linked hydrolase [Thermoanaerobaculaceae bacterium]